MRHSIRWFYPWAVVAYSSVALTAACGDEPPAAGHEERQATGTLRAELSAVGSQGHRYRLRQAQFSITGVVSRGFASDDFLSSDAALLELQPGNYSIALGGAWFLERLTDNGFRPAANAELISPSSIDFAIFAQATTPVAFRFQVGGELVEFGNGAVSVGIEVNEVAGAGGQAGFAGRGQGGIAGRGGVSGAGGTGPAGGSAGKGGAIAGASGSGQTMGGSTGIGGRGSAGFGGRGGFGGGGGAAGATTCGDGILNDGEACDDGNENPCDGCAACALHDPPPAGAIIAPELITEDTIWCGNQSPVTVASNVVVLQGATLFVGPGTRIESASDQGLQIRGALEVQGSTADPAVFTSTSPTPGPGAWFGISVVSTSQKTVLDGAVVEYAAVGLLSSQQQSMCCIPVPQRPTVRNSLFRHNLAALQNVHEIRASEVSNNVRGVIGFADLIEDSVFENNAQFAVERVTAVRRSIFAHNGLETEGFFCSSSVCSEGGFGIGFGGQIEDSRFANNRVGIVSAGTLLRAVVIANDIGMSSAGGIQDSLIADNQVGARSVGGDLLDNTIVRNKTGIGLGRGLQAHGNTLCNETDLELSSQTVDLVDAANNWWCSVDSVFIGNRVFDVFDDINRGPILFTPFLTAPPPNAPADPGPPSEGPPGGANAGAGGANAGAGGALP